MPCKVEVYRGKVVPDANRTKMFRQHQTPDTYFIHFNQNIKISNPTRFEPEVKKY